MQEQHHNELRIRLRAVNQGDASFLWRVANNPALLDILCDRPSDEKCWRDIIDAWQTDTDEAVFVIAHKPGGTPIGWLGINGLLSTAGIAWLKMIVLLPEFWGEGYGSEALRQVKTLLLAKGFSRLRLWTDQCNLRSQDCYRRNGFVVIDHRRASIGTRNVTRDRVLMEGAVVDQGDKGAYTPSL